MAFGIGKKNKDGKQVRIEHRGEHVRASRTGGVAARAGGKLGPVNATVNTAHGVRLSTRVAHATRVAFQNGRFQLIGRYRQGPFHMNLSKSGVSFSMKNDLGAYNVFKPQYSSFRFAGIQLRGHKAAQLQLAYLLVQLLVALLVMAFAGLMIVLNLLAYGLWFVYLSLVFAAVFVRDAVKDFIQQGKEEVIQATDEEH